MTVETSNVARGLRAPAVLAWLRLVRVFQKVTRVSEDRMRCKGLTGAQFDVLAHVGAEEGLSQQDLADSLLVTKGNVCQLLDRMEASELLERRQEGRLNRLYLTPDGRRLAAQVIPEEEDGIVEQFSGLTASEQAQLLELLRKLDRSLS